FDEKLNKKIGKLFALIKGCKEKLNFSYDFYPLWLSGNLTKITHICKSHTSFHYNKLLMSIILAFISHSIKYFCN
ncbi:MAG: hypothetical protein ACFFG0_24695, partial [Candidatus Thorarchaeota archaeon]